MLINFNDKTDGFDCVNFTFKNTSNFPITVDLFDTQTYLYNIPDLFNPPALSFEIGGTMNYNQWNQDSLMAPKLIKSIKIMTYSVNGSGVITPSATPLQNLNTYYQNVTGETYTHYKHVVTLVDAYQKQSYIVKVDFDDTEKEFVLNGDNYIAQYTFPRNSLTQFNIEFAELPNVDHILFGNNKGIIANNQIVN